MFEYKKCFHKRLLCVLTIAILIVMTAAQTINPIKKVEFECTRLVSRMK